MTFDGAAEREEDDQHRPDSDGNGTVLIILFPFGGTIIYMVTRPSADKITYKGDPPIA